MPTKRTLRGHRTESALRDAIRVRLTHMKKSGEPIEFRKVLGGPATRCGEPDWDIVYHSRAVKLEAKIGNKKATPLQQHRLDQWAKAGAKVGVVWTVEDVVQVLAEVKEEALRAHAH